MSYEQKINTLNIFKNEYKEKDSHPEYKGKIRIDPSILDENGFAEIGLWVKETQAGKKFLGGSASKPYKKDSANNAQTEDSSEIPF